MSTRSPGGGGGGYAGGRSRFGQNSDPVQEPITAEQNQNHFGKRMGAKFYHEDLMMGTTSVPIGPLAGSSNSTTSGLDFAFKLEVLEREINDLGSCNYRKKLSNHNTGNNSESKPGSRTEVLGLKSSFSPSQDEIIATVAKQLKMIQETQDDILDSLKRDIEIIQTENSLLRQNNTRLQNQVSQMNQLVADLSFDLRQMRDLISTKQKLGISLPLSDLNGAHKSRKGECHRRRGGKESKENSPPVLTPSQGTIDLRSHHPRCQKVKSKTGDKTRMDVDKGRDGKGENRREKRLRTQESTDSPPKHSGCFKGLFGRNRKKSTQDADEN